MASVRAKGNRSLSVADLVIIHTNDLHNRLDEAGAAILRRQREGCGAVLLDAGDAAQAGNVYYRPGGERILEAMSQAGYDAMTVGNREFHFTAAGFQSKVSRASFTCLCANVRPSRGCALPCAPYVILERGDLRIGVIGVTVPMVTPRMRTAAFSAFVFDPPVETARRVASDIRGQCDVLVALTHIGLRHDRELAAEAPDLDLIVGGHSHDCLEAPEMAGKVPIVQAGCHARSYGIVELTRSGGRFLVQSRLEPLRGAAS